MPGSPTIMTRRERVAHLMSVLHKGPPFTISAELTHEHFTPEGAEAEYRRWASEWVIPLVRQLLPDFPDESEDEFSA